MSDTTFSRGRLSVRDPCVAALTVLAVTACTYGPREERATVEQIIRLGDSYRAVAVIRHDVFRRPTGLTAFPDGGRWRFLERRAVEVLLDARARRAVVLATQLAPDGLWESFGAAVAGLVGDSAVYVRLTGCPRGGECYPELQNQQVYRLSAEGESSLVSGVPTGVGVPGGSVARGPEEENYVRYRVSGDTITIRLEEGGGDTALVVVRSDGTVGVVDP